MHFSFNFRNVLSIAICLLSSLFTQFTYAEEKPPKGVEMLLPRGGIPAIFDPEFVPADRADIDEDAWVLGVYHNGEAKAYSLNLLNHHEVVNDEVGGAPVAAVW